MKITEEYNRVIIDGVKDFHLDHTFDNGQCFRWNKEEDGSYTGVAFGRVANINYIEDAIILNNVTLEDYHEIWKDYLDLDRDYGVIKTMLSGKDPTMRKAVLHGGGMRILQQDKWETLISFIISQNNNIPRIKKCVEGLCKSHGSPAGTYKGRMYYAFPKPEALAQLSAEELDICKLGYRAKYIIETAKQITSDGEGNLERLDTATTMEAYEYLLSLSGVGPKVANCIMLFSMGKYESFPLDVWIKRVMNQVYHIEEGNVKKMQAYAADHFGEYGGIAQQYLFYFMRENKKQQS
ncbi:MAG TPA: DNA glycosylase [Anaerovoracaceae bacterium]|nr:DNA glycosylase [Anaerovoracaceae bacterium]